MSEAFISNCREPKHHPNIDVPDNVLLQDPRLHVTDGKTRCRHYVTLTEQERFWAQVEMTDACWTWIGSMGRLGYGRFSVGRKWFRAYRLAYTYFYGSVPEGMELDHLCRNPACVRPSHLEAVTHLENVRRGMGGTNTRTKTHCPRGHPYDEQNTRIELTKYGYKARHCRTCHGG